MTETNQKQYVQVGVIAQRDRKTGEFGIAVPLYIEADREAAAADIAAALCSSKPFRDMVLAQGNKDEHTNGGEAI